VQPALPGLLGLPRDYLIGQLGAWQTGQRHAQAPDCMAQIAKQLTPADVSAVAAWLAAQPVPPAAQADATAPGPVPLRCGSTDHPPP
jgi:cytochrome c553